jgi:hypothetical protein
MEEKGRGEEGSFFRQPLSSILSPLVPREERKKMSNAPSSFGDAPCHPGARRRRLTFKILRRSVTAWQGRLQAHT